MNNLVRKLCMATAAVAMVGSLGACASAARPDAMTVLPSSIQVAQPQDFAHRGLKISNVNGGTSTNPLWTSQVSTQDFRIALEESLRGANYLGSETNAPLALTASLLDLKQPLAGFDMSVTSTVRYSVTDGAGGMIFDETVSAVGTARMGEAFAGTERLRLANEYSIRENIKSFIERFRASTANRK